MTTTATEISEHLDSVRPNLTDYEDYRSAFTWEQAEGMLAGLPGGGLNIAYEAVDRHVVRGAADRTALRLIARNGDRRDVSYGELARRTNKFANALAEQGVVRGDVVAVLCGRDLDLYVAVLGALKHRCVVAPMFSAFGPEPIRSRLLLGKVRVVVTTPDLYVRKLAPMRAELPLVDRVIVTGGESTCPPDTLALDVLLADADEHYEIQATDREDVALLHFTSGTTGTPKGALHVHGAVVAHAATGRLALDLHDGDVFWCTADPGWVTGTSYGIISPLVCGVTMVVDEAEADPARWYGILAEEKVNVWYTAPTAIRLLMRAGTDVENMDRPRPALRLAASVGEPLDPEAVLWGAQTLGLPFHDNWWQTETGGIMVANFRAMPIRPGSMGRPMPGIEAAIVHCDDEGHPIKQADGNVEVLLGEAEGMLALRAGWPSMFRGYVDAPERYASCFAEANGVRWYLSGDLVRRDRDGYYWFVARADDVIKTSGHLIGPFEVESALMEHPDVVGAGVYGVPDQVAGALVHAVVVLRAGVVDDAVVRRSIMAHARSRLGAAVAPRQITVAVALPKTRSGKIMRRVLRARELGLPEGDTSTLESGATT